MSTNPRKVYVVGVGMTKVSRIQVIQ